MNIDKIYKPLKEKQIDPSMIYFDIKKYRKKEVQDLEEKYKELADYTIMIAKDDTVWSIDLLREILSRQLDKTWEELNGE